MPGLASNIYSRVGILVFILSLTLPIPNRVSAQELSFGKYTYEDSLDIQLPSPLEFERDSDEVLLDQVIEPSRYIVGPGDEISISIKSLVNIAISTKVTPAGNILIPNIGPVHVNGLTLEKSVEVITKACHSVFLESDVHVDLVGIREFQVLVSGAVTFPGLVPATPVDRVSRVIQNAGGMKQMAREHEVLLISAEGDTSILNLNDFLSEGDLSQNPYVDIGYHIHVGYGDLETEVIVIRGEAKGKGYDVIETGETLEKYFHRNIILNTGADLEQVTIERKTGDRIDFHTIPPDELNEFVLEPGDAVEIIPELPVIVQGHVGNPGAYKYIPGYTAGQYLSIAGGILPSGSSSRVRIIRIDGARFTGSDIEIQRGDLIIVDRSFFDFLFGEITVLQFVSTVSSIILAYIAATK